MSLVLSVYSRESFEEYMLPSIDNSDHTITLMKDAFGLVKDVHLRLEVMEGKWSICYDDAYRIIDNDQVTKKKELTDQTVFRLSIDGKPLSVIASEVGQAFHEMVKYSLDSVTEINIGKEPGNDIVYDSMGMVSRRHARLFRDQDGFAIENMSPNGVYINSTRVDDKARLDFGDFVNIIGLHIVFLGSKIAVDISGNTVQIKDKLKKEDVTVDYGTVVIKDQDQQSESKTVYHRAPRQYKPLEEKEITIEEKPDHCFQANKSAVSVAGPAVIMALPMLLGFLLMIFAVGGRSQSSILMTVGLAIAVISAVAGVAWTAANMRAKNRLEVESEQKAEQEYKLYLEKKTEEIKQLSEDALSQMNENYPDPEKCLSYDERNKMLWNRNKTHSDYLTHRLGTGKVPSPVHISVSNRRMAQGSAVHRDELDSLKSKNEFLESAPITIDFLSHRLIGIVGGEDKKGAVQVACSLSAQLALNNCYTDVKMGFFYDDNSSEDSGCWDFAKWLPHVWSEDKKTRFVAAGKEEARDVLYELTNIIRDRVQSSEEDYGMGSTLSSPQIPKPYYVVFISDPSLLEGELFRKYAYGQAESAGLTTILLAHHYEELPNECNYIIENTESFSGMYSASGSTDRREIVFDNVDIKKFEKKARQLASFKVQEIEEGGEIPESLSFLEMLGVRRPEDLHVRELWAKNRVFESISGLIGERAGGAPCRLDIHEKFHGPHGLVAGTTGSGKSEMLQSYLLSLAVNYSPEDISFFIIDYKGGGMANLFEGLPHMAGQISNLSGNQVRRAMIALKSENRRRQILFNKYGVNNINNYIRLYRNGEADSPVPHLLVVIDEFAELKREEPEFMQELISVAQVGRSLGVHLILATQKPGGTVDDNIWSNSRFRLCLRVQNKDDSNDMLHKHDAAYITQTGRGYLQVGNDEIYECFQSGYSGAPFDEEMTGRDEKVRLITLNGKTDISDRTIRMLRKKDVSRDVKTEFQAVKEHLQELAGQYGLACGHILWLPVLKEKIYLNDIAEEKQEHFCNSGKWPQAVGKNSGICIPVGEVDDPANQEQYTEYIDFAKDGNIAVCGSVGSGKSTFMQTIAYSLINRYTPDVINMYAIDFSSRMMSAFEDAPHFGGVMYENDTEKIDRFFNMMKKILAERKDTIKGGNFRQFIESGREGIPAMVIFIDNYAGFNEKTESKYEEDLIQLSREGNNLGIYLAVSGARFGIGDITTRVADNLGKVLTLQLKDKFAYCDLLHVMKTDVLPETGVRGRGLLRSGDRVLEYQAALAMVAENDYERMEKIRDVCRRMKGSWDGRSARAVPEIPAEPEWGTFSAQEDYKRAQERKDLLPVGYNEDDAEVYSLCLENIYCYGVYGSKRTGKKNFLKACVLSALDKGADVCVMDSTESEFSVFCGGDKAARFCSDENSIFEYFKELLPVFKERNQKKNELVNDGAEDEEVFRDMSQNTKPVFIVIPDMAWLIPLVYDSHLEMRGFLENVIEKGRYHNIYFIGALETEKRAQTAGYRCFETFIDYKTGIHFGGRTIDDPLLDFDQLPYSQQVKTEKPGVGIAADPLWGGKQQRVIMPRIKAKKG